MIHFRLANAKEFLGHKYCQRWLEKEWITSPSGDYTLQSKSIPSAVVTIVGFGSNLKKTEDEAESELREKRNFRKSDRMTASPHPSPPRVGKRVRLLRSFASFFDAYQIPFVKIILHSFTFFAFLILLLISCMSPPSPTLTFIDMMVMLWVFGKSIEEVTQYIEEMDLYLEDFWNIVSVFFLYFGTSDLFPSD